MIQPNTQKAPNRFKRFFHTRHHFKYLLMGVAVLLALTLVLQLAWNIVVPALFGLPSITFGQALGMMILLRLTAGIMGFTRRRLYLAGSMRDRLSRFEHGFIGCDNHRII